MQIQSPLKSEAASRRKLVHIEVLRLIAVFLVIYNHTGTAGLLRYTVTPSPVLRIIYLLLYALAQIAVPLFFMISGALLLGKEEDYAVLFRRRVLKFVLALLVFSALYYFWRNDPPYSLKEFLVKTYSSIQAPQLWYLYAYLGLLLMMPLLRKMVRAMKKKDFVYVLICHMVFCSLLPLLEKLFLPEGTHLNGCFSIPLMTVGSIFYALMGYFLERILVVENYRTKHILIGSAVSLAFFGFSVLFCLCFHDQETDSFSKGILQSLLVFPALHTYFSFKWLFSRHQPGEKARRFLAFWGSTTFGIYLTEGFLRDVTYGIYTGLAAFIPGFLACFLWILTVFLLCSLITAVLLQIPLIRRLF